MKPLLLFPSFFRLIGYVLAAAGLVFGFIYIYLDELLIFADHGSHNYTSELGTTFEILGPIFIGFARLKIENDTTIKTRLKAIYWAVLVDFLLLLIYWLLLFMGEMFKISWLGNLPNLLYYNSFIFLFIFVGRFYYLLIVLKNNKKQDPLSLLPYKPYLLLVKLVFAVFFLLIVASAEFGEVDGFLKKVIPAEVYILFPVCLLIWISSKEKHESGDVANIRLIAMQLSVYINYSLFLFETWYFYGVNYLIVLFIGIISIPLVFLMVFYAKLFMLKRRHSAIQITNL